MSDSSLSYPHLVFVYGTLKKTEPNHGVLMDSEKYGNQEFVCQGNTVEKYPLILASRYNIPYLLDAPGKGKHVCGEIYSVDDNMLKSLDKLEDIPAFYQRKLTKILPQNRADELNCWIYVLTDYKEELLQKTYLSDYTAIDPKNEPFVPKHRRETKDFYWEVKQLIK